MVGSEVFSANFNKLGLDELGRCTPPGVIVAMDGLLWARRLQKQVTYVKLVGNCEGVGGDIIMFLDGRDLLVVVTVF